MVVTLCSHPQTGPEPSKAGGWEEEALAMPEIPLSSQGGTNLIPIAQNPLVLQWQHGPGVSTWALESRPHTGQGPISTTFWLRPLPELLNLFESWFLTNKMGMTLISTSQVVGNIK